MIELFKEEGIIMNVANVATADISATQEVVYVSSGALDLSLQASIQVMDMANANFEAAAQQLIDSMAAMTGVGQNFDTYI